MDTIPADTHPDVHAMQIELLRRAGPERRAQMGWAMTETALRRAREALRRTHPDADEVEIGLLFVQAHYGHELAAKVRAHLGR